VEEDVPQEEEGGNARTVKVVKAMPCGRKRKRRKKRRKR